MIRALVFPALFAFLTANSAQSNNLDQEARDFCLQAKDYLGCLEANTKSKAKELKSKSFKIKNKNLNKPACERKPSGNGWKAFRGMHCEVCHRAYAANLQGKSTILSGNKEDQKQWISRLLPKARKLYSPSLNIPDRRFERGIKQRLNIATKKAKKVCPSLY